MLKKIVSGIVMTVLLTGVVASVLNMEVVGASHSAVVEFFPSSYIFNADEVYVGYKFNATVYVLDVENLHGWQVHILYDENLINVSRCFEGKVFSYTKATTFVYRYGNGSFLCESSLLGDQYPFSGSGTLVVVEFEILKIPPYGETYSCILNIDNEDTFLLDRYANEIMAVKQDGYYEIRGMFPPIYIKADGSIEPLDAPITSPDNVTYILTDNITSSGDGIVVERDNIIINGAGYTIQGVGVKESKGIDLFRRTNVTVSNTQIKNFNYGIYLENSSNINLSGNNITNNGYGIGILNSYNNTIRGNVIKNHTILKDSSGITTHYTSSYKNIIQQNYISDNLLGVNLANSYENSILNNTIMRNKYGIMLAGTMSCNNILYGNIISNNGEGIKLCLSSNNTISNNIINLNSKGVELDFSNYNTIKCNKILNNTGLGVFLSYSSNNIIYHNNFINNAEHVLLDGSTNIWDDGYPSGGNYWSDYAGVDLYSGPFQNETGSDGIGDTPYVIDENNVDHYPLINPWTPTPPIPEVLTATVGIHPEALNLRSKGRWITASIELPEGYNVGDINVSSILLNDTIPVDLSKPIAIGDYDNDTVLDLMVCFNWTEVSEYILFKGIVFGNITLELSGKLYDGTVFVGTDVVLVSSLIGDVNIDGKVDIEDIFVAALSFGSYPDHPRWNPNADFTKDGYIGIDDIYLTARNFGKQA